MDGQGRDRGVAWAIVATAVWLGWAFLAVSAPGAAEPPATSHRSTGTRGASKDRASTERAKRLARIEEKLAQVLANQNALLEKSASFKQELQVIKVRATSRGALSQ